MRPCKECEGLNAGNWSEIMGYSIAYSTYLNLAYAKNVDPDFYYVRTQKRSCVCWKAQTVYNLLRDTYYKFHLGLTPMERKHRRLYGSKYLEALSLIQAHFEIIP